MSDETFRYIKFSPFKRSKSASKSGLKSSFTQLPHLIPPKQKPLDTLSKKEPILHQKPLNTQPISRCTELSTSNTSSKICSNCKALDHVVKNCKCPIYSYGLIVFDHTNDNILMVQRKDTYAYIALIESDEYQSFSEIAKKITRLEHHKLLTWEFEELWADVINNPRTKNNKKLLLHKKSLFEFHKIRDIVRITNIDLLTDNTQWSFPKGRIKLNESWSECAIRETCEETHLSNRDVWIIIEDPLYDTNIGDDGKTYISILYVGRTFQYNSLSSTLTSTSTNETKQCAFVNVNEIEKLLGNNKKELINKIKEIATGLQLGP